ncbi:MAG: hypothetical protein ACUVSK_13870 [Desulfotomaculales bacterium]
MLPEEEVLLTKQSSGELLDVLERLMGRNWAARFAAQPEERFWMLMQAGATVVARIGDWDKGYEFTRLVIAEMAGENVATS